MHHSFNQNFRVLAPGEVFVARSSLARSESAFLTVTENKGSGIFCAVDKHGAEFTATYGSQNLKKQGDPNNWWPMWTLPLPKLPEKETLAYIAALSRSTGYDAPILLHVREIGSEHAVARLVFSRHDEGRLPGDFTIADEEGMAIPFTWSETGTALVMDQDVLVPVEELPEGCGALDLLTSNQFRCEVEDGKLITHVHRGNHCSPLIIGRTVEPASLQDFVPYREASGDGRFARSTMKLVDPFDFACEAENAETRTHPDEALVLWFQPEDAKPDDTACHVLGHTGYVFHVTDSIEDQFYGNGVEPGVWIFRNAKFWSYESYEGERDWGIDGDWEPATLADLDRFGYTAESLTVEIRDIVEDSGIETGEGDLSGQWLALAHENASKSREAAALATAALPAMEA